MSSEIPSTGDSFATLAVKSGFHPEEAPPHYPLVEPLVTSSTFKQLQPGVYKDFDYSRTGNPCRQNLERRLAALEGAKHAAVFPSGVGVAYAISSLFSPGDHFVVSKQLYGGTMRCFVNMEQRRGFHIDYEDLTGDVRRVLEKKLRKDTKMLFFETPTNPTMTMVDIKVACEVAKSIAKDIVIVVDNTFLTSFFQRPLELGATISMYSLTKYINGHSDVVLGAAVTNCPEVYDGLFMMQDVNGLCPSPFDCYQVSRGSKTLALRMQRHHENSLKIARFLEKSPFVTKVNHPLLESHPSHQLALRQTTGHSGIMSFCLRGGIVEATKFMDELKIIQLAPSLGGVETLVASPALMTHYMITQEKRDQMGITDSLVRLAVGIESATDLIRDIEQALRATYE